jgi:hypothetical protein
MIRGAIIALCTTLATGYVSSARADSARGCTYLGLEGCYYLQVGKQRVALTAEPGVVLPPPRTYILAKGKFYKIEIGFCGVSRGFRASSVIATKRFCPPQVAK